MNESESSGIIILLIYITTSKNCHKYRIDWVWLARNPLVNPPIQGMTVWVSSQTGKKY